MSWKPEAEEIAQRRRWALELGGPESVERYKAQGWLTIRERIDLAVDPGSFREIGQLAGSARYVEGKLDRVTPATSRHLEDEEDIVIPLIQRHADAFAH